jgi:ATP-dependent Clp protease ATP-binding subunit ClpA
MTPPPSLQDLIDTVHQDSPTEDPFDLLVTASATVSQLEAANDALLGHFVDRCRRDGRSWSQISAALGVSKQAVHKRFSGPIADRVAERLADQASPTFERFTARARSVLAATDVAARERGAAEVTAEHLLVGLFAEPDGVAARVLADMHVSREAVLAALPAAEPGADASGPLPPGHAARLPYGETAVAALRDAVAEAFELGHNYIGTEHILLREPQTPAAELLGQLGASQDETRVRIAELLRGYASGSA